VISGRLSLTARAFLFSFLPVCLVLSASFLILRAAVDQKIRPIFASSSNRPTRC